MINKKGIWHIRTSGVLNFFDTFIPDTVEGLRTDMENILEIKTPVFLNVRR